MRILLLVPFFLVLSLVAPHSFAQQSGTTTFTFSNPPDSTADLNRQVTLARQLMQRQNYGAAADMLELVYEKSPKDPSVISMLRVCYAQLKQYPKAELLIRRQLEQAPNLGTWIDLAEVQADQGSRDSSRVSYREARKLIPPGDTIRFLSLLRSQISRDLRDDAALLIDTLRQQFHDSSLFALEKGEILEHAKDYRGAIREYAPALKADTAYEGMEAERRLMALLDFVDASADVEKALQEEATRTNNSIVIRLLADHYIKVNQFDKAFGYAIKRDSLFQFHGVSLVAFMRQCHDLKMYAEAVRMGDYVMAKFPTGPTFVDALLVYADALAQLGRTKDALARYEQVVATSPNPQDKGEALFDIGMIYFDDGRDFPLALKYFDSVASHYQAGLPYINARRMRPYCHLRVGDREAARAAFKTLKTDMVIPDITEEASYELAVLAFYDKQYDSTNAWLRKLIVDFPRGFYVNDAIQILMILDDAKAAPDLLGLFSEALWYQECGHEDSSRIWLERVTRDQNQVLADDALFRLVMLDLSMSDSAAATAEIERLTDSFPTSYYVPFGLREKADILAGNPATMEEARSVYKRILEQFPNYPFVSEVRKKLRQMEIDRKIG